MNNFIKLGQFKSNGRLVSEPINKFRTPFQRDRDRIIHSEAFRRLKHKTQVFVNTDGDHFRTRITHSIEVSQIARTISKYLHLNEELTETIYKLGFKLDQTLDQIISRLDYIIGGESDGN